MSKQNDKAADLLIPGDEYLIELINANNGTTYTVEQVNDGIVIGSPRVSADEAYNTDIEITFPVPPSPGNGDPDPVTGELHYDRFDLGRLFAEKNIVLRDNSYTTVADLLEPLLGEVRLAFGEDDLTQATLPTTFPKRVVLHANPISLRFIGQFSIEIIEPITPDTSFLITPTITPNTTPSNKALKRDGSGTLHTGTGHSPAALFKATNNEIEVCGGARLYNIPMVFSSVDGEYRLNIADSADWTFLYSFALLDKRNADRLTDLYDCSVKVTAPGGGVLDFELKRQYGKLALVDEDNELTIDDPAATNEDQTLYQDIQRVTYYKGKLGSLPVNAAGAPFGTYEIELRAVRKTGGQDPVVVTFDVVVTGTAP